LAIFVTGDTHGGIDINKFNSDNIKKLEYNFSKEKDYIIVCGDFGLLFSTDHYNQTEAWRVKWLDEKPWITLFVDGNHENFERVNALPDVPMFGGTVGKYNDNIYHLKRGEVYTIEGKKFFVMGGGVSIDKEQRRNRITWWEEEMPNYAEYAKALESLHKVNFTVDYVLTHTAPDPIRKMLLGGDNYKSRDQLSTFFEELISYHRLSFKTWYFGHYHCDAQIHNGQYEALFNRIMRVKT
jgi:predicted phosphodiesterase